MDEEEFNGLIGRVLDGHASDEDRALLLAFIESHPGRKAEVAEQLMVDGLLGVTLADHQAFHDSLKLRIAGADKMSPFRRIQDWFSRNMRPVAMILGPILAAATWLSLSSILRSTAVPDVPQACWAGAILVLCATWWLFEPVPIPVTGLIPLAVFPLTGVLDERQVAASYGHPLVLLFLSGFILSKAVEHSGAHRRLALGMVRLIGGSGGRRLVLGFMIASAGLSMWISNTATVLMMLPVAIAVIDQSRGRWLATPLLLGVAYAASIGGIATPIGTPPNLVFLAQADVLLADGLLDRSPDFLGWMKVGLPVAVILIPLSWLWLTRGNWPAAPIRMSSPGPWQPAEIRASSVLGITALLWITREGPFGGWSGWFGIGPVEDSTVGLLAAISLFLIPAGGKSERKLLDWERAVAIPWGVLILFGGGIALGNAFTVTGLGQVVAQNLGLVQSLPPLLLVAAVVLVVTFLTEFTSNTATATVLMPLLAATAVSADLPPMLLMAPAAMATSCAFMLPIATPPNAIVFAVGDFSIRRMVWEGFVINCLSVVVITLVCYWLLG